ncbi:hypothetical protein Bbelb_129910 [Branchiostoma belcheri]|nr:hypothetical protein Bbelb_129910 [Branchiostoma belcheri]
MVRSVRPAQLCDGRLQAACWRKFVEVSLRWRAEFGDWKRYGDYHVAAWRVAEEDSFLRDVDLKPGLSGRNNHTFMDRSSCVKERWGVHATLRVCMPFVRVVWS